MKVFRLFITYIKQNRLTGEEYIGHASGMVSENNRKAADLVMKKRDSSHHKNKEGFGAGEIDEISDNKDAIIGREQLLISHLREQDICGNSRNAISPRKNKKMERCIKAAIKIFGAVSVMLIFLYLCNRV